MSYRSKEEVVAEIVRLREDRGISQRDVAEALDVDQSAVSRLERGERGIAVSELGILAEMLSVEVEELLVEADDEAVVFRGDRDDPDAKLAVEQADQLIDNLLYYRALIR